MLLPLLLGPGLAPAEDPMPERITEQSVLAPLVTRSLLLDAAMAGRRVVVVGERGHVLLSDDAGESWRQVVVPTSVTLTAVHFSDPEHGFAVGHDAVVLHTADAGETWTRQYADPELRSPLLDVWFADRRHGFAVGAYGLFLETQDAGATWVSRTITDLDVHHNAIVSTRDGTLVVAGERGSVFRSIDGGETWEPMPLPGPGSLFGALGLPDGGLLVFGLLGHAYRWQQEAARWQEFDNPSEASLMGGTITPGDVVVLGGLNGVVLLSRDFGKTFELRRRADRQAVSTAVAPPGDGLVLVGAFGVDAGSTFLGPGGLAGGGGARP